MGNCYVIVGGEVEMVPTEIVEMKFLGVWLVLKKKAEVVAIPIRILARRWFTSDYERNISIKFDTCVGNTTPLNANR